jgi:hypothetical protein
LKKPMTSHTIANRTGEVLNLLGIRRGASFA